MHSPTDQVGAVRLGRPDLSDTPLGQLVDLLLIVAVTRRQSQRQIWEQPAVDFSRAAALDVLGFEMIEPHRKQRSLKVVEAGGATAPDVIVRATRERPVVAE